MSNGTYIIISPAAIIFIMLIIIRKRLLAML